MANNRYNKQVTPKGYKMGGRIKKMGGGMMMQRPMMEKGGKIMEAAKAAAKKGKVRGDIKLGRALVEAFGSKKTINKMKSNIQDKNRVKKMDGGRAKGLIPEAQEKAKSMTVKSSKRRVKKMGGGSLKAVPADNKGLKKLPTEVRNKMGFMKKGGVVSDTKKKQFKANQAGQKTTNKKVFDRSGLNLKRGAEGYINLGKKIVRKFKGDK